MVYKKLYVFRRANEMFIFRKLKKGKSKREKMKKSKKSKNQKIKK
ncbi:hypothetical protein M153_12800017518 [Pseudoloma neurophilia]|uniref:Uncharacterized protein n=1 Tax=Pseudoloma neurophilia TaxID=146866 RepID=A0A0R0M5K1_9MICR|nr:hypothetical protein M153_12800017518 [Pseudoloma neurophilia]